MSYPRPKSGPETSDLATSTQSLETRETQSCCCHFLKCRGPVQSQSEDKKKHIASSEFCDKKTCCYYRTTRKDVPQSKVRKKSPGLRNSPHPVNQDIRHQEFLKKPDYKYEEKQNWPLTSKSALYNREIQTDRKPTKVICGRPRICIQPNVHELFESEKEFSEACEAVFIKCQNLKDISLGEAQDCRNRIIYCASPTVLKNKAVTPQGVLSKKNKVTTYEENLTERPKSKTPPLQIPCKLEICKQKNCDFVPVCIKSEKNIINKCCPCPKSNNILEAKNQEPRNILTKISENIPEDIIEISKPSDLKMEADLPDCCKRNVDGENPDIAVADCCQGNTMDSSSTYNPAPSITYDPHTTQSLSKMTTLDIPSCCNQKQTLEESPPDGKFDKITSSVSKPIDENLSSTYVEKPPQQIIPDSFVEEFHSKEVSSPEMASCCAQNKDAKPSNKLHLAIDDTGQKNSPVPSKQALMKNTPKKDTNEGNFKQIPKTKSLDNKRSAKNIPSASRSGKIDQPSKQKISNTFRANPSKEVSPPEMPSYFVDQLDNDNTGKNRSPEPFNKHLSGKTSKMDCCKDNPKQTAEEASQDKNEETDKNLYPASKRIEENLSPNYYGEPSKQKIPESITKANTSKEVPAPKTMSCCEDIELTNKYEEEPSKLKIPESITKANTRKEVPAPKTMSCEDVELTNKYEVEPSKLKIPESITKANTRKEVPAPKTMSCCEDVELTDEYEVEPSKLKIPESITKANTRKEVPAPKTMSCCEDVELTNKYEEEPSKLKIPESITKANTRKEVPAPKTMSCCEDVELTNKYEVEPSKLKIPESITKANTRKEVPAPKTMSCCEDVELTDEYEVEHSKLKIPESITKANTRKEEPAPMTMSCCEDVELTNKYEVEQSKLKIPESITKANTRKEVPAPKTMSCCEDVELTNKCEVEPSKLKIPESITKANTRKEVPASKTLSCCKDIELTNKCQVGKSPRTNQNNDIQECGACEEEKVHFQSFPEPSKRPYCVPTTCPKLNMPSTSNYCDNTNCEKLNLNMSNKKHKICCDKSKCPINDPTTSTYKFLLKTRLCCNRRACQLAAKICDIYEPLVNVEMDIGSSEYLGEDRYHFLGTDAYTSYDQEKEMKEPSTTETGSTYIIEMPDDDFVRESVYIDPEEPPRRERRASTVSWVVPSPSQPGSELLPENDLSISVSAEQIIAQATAAANKFRQSPQGPKHPTLFNDIVKKKESQRRDPKELSHQTLQSDLLFKSQLDNINLSNSRHKTNCCSSLKKKFRRKKRAQDKSDEEFGDTENYSNWRSSFESDRKRVKLDPVTEKKQQINNMLNNM